MDIFNEKLSPKQAREVAHVARQAAQSAVAPVIAQLTAQHARAVAPALQRVAAEIGKQIEPAASMPAIRRLRQ